MKLINMVVAVLSFPACVASGDIVRGPDHKENILGQWSAPAEIVLQSERGPIRADRQRLSVDRLNAKHIEHYTIDFVSSTELSHSLLTPATESYIAIGGRIAACDAYGETLRLHFGDAGRLEFGSTAFQEKLRKLLEDSRNAFEPPEEVVRYNLLYVFGPDVFSKQKNDARGGSFSIVDSFPENGNLVFHLKTPASVALGISLNPNRELVAITKNGRNLRLLRTGKRIEGWSWPHDIHIATPSGARPIPGCRRLYDLPTGAHPEGALAVWADDGEGWIGDGGCQLARVGKTMIGFKVGTNAQLLAYAGDFQIPITNRSEIAFENRLTSFDSALAANIFPKPKVIELAPLFPARTLATDPDLFLRWISLKDGNLELQIRTNEVGNDLLVVLNPNLSVISWRSGKNMMLRRP